MDRIQNIGAIVSTIVAASSQLYELIEAAMEDGELTSEEAAEIGRLFSKDVLGNLRITRHGRDILHAPAQAAICEGLARMIRQDIIVTEEAGKVHPLTVVKDWLAQIRAALPSLH